MQYCNKNTIFHSLCCTIFSHKSLQNADGILQKLEGNIAGMVEKLKTFTIQVFYFFNQIKNMGKFSIGILYIVITCLCGSK